MDCNVNNISNIKNNCFGCSACLNICPNNAIEMVENNEGFKYPVINNNCTNCGLCRKVCPYLICSFKNNKEPDCYAFIADDNIRINSSSGGAFPVLARYFIEHDGYVVGAVYKNDISVQHIISNNLVDIENMRNSKYLQSDIGNCYKETKIVLDKNKLVLFTGTPCQISGLKSYLRKDYENLYCIDVICHGVPSPKIFRKYINEKIKNKDERWLNTNFRNKSKGIWSWFGNGNAITTTTTKKSTIDFTQNDIYMKSFLSNLCLRKTCTNCKFQTIPRQGDITIGDFWGIWDFNKNLNDEKGTSVVLSNNSKGSCLMNILKRNSKLLQEVPLKYAINGNPCLTTSSIQHNARNLFFKLINKKTLDNIYNICDNDKVDYLIVNFWHTMNYGASITAWAIQNLIESYGYTCMLLNRENAWDNNLYNESFSKKFAEQFLNISKAYSLYDLNKLSKNLKGVILGSDQVLRLDYIDYNIHKYLLNWVVNAAKKITFSASFGINKAEFLYCSKYTKDTAKLMKSALQSFDYLSCREISGKEIYKDVFDLDSDWIFDPVFLIDKEEYNKILQYATIDNSDKIVSYVLDDNEEYDKSYNYLSNKENLDVVKINGKNYNVEDWLKSIKDCRLLITDSFHGVCFALIFNKPFICIRNKDRGNDRFETLIEYFKLTDNFVYSIQEIYDKDFNYNINYININNLISEKRNKDLKIIDMVLNENYSNNSNAQENKEKNSKYLKSIKSVNWIKRLNLKVNYYRCRFLANITFGKKRERYIAKKHFLKMKLEQ